MNIRGRVREGRRKRDEWKGEKEEVEGDAWMRLETEKEEIR